MAENVKVCDIDPELKDLLKKFRFRKATNNAAIIMKIDRDTQTVMLEEEHEDCTLDELQDELPASQPRYIAYSYVMEHDDGRKSYPLCFIFVSPSGCKPEQQMMYAGSQKSLVNEAGFTKVFEIRSHEEMTEEWLLEKMRLYK